MTTPKITAKQTAAVIAVVNAVTAHDSAAQHLQSRLYSLLLAAPKGLAVKAWADQLHSAASTPGNVIGEGGVDAGAMLIGRYGTPGSLRVSMVNARKAAVAQGFEGDPTAWSKAIAQGKAAASVKTVQKREEPGKPKAPRKRPVTVAAVKDAEFREVAPTIAARLQAETDAVKAGATPKRGTAKGDEYAERCAATARNAMALALAAGVDVEALLADVLASK